MRPMKAVVGARPSPGRTAPPHPAPGFELATEWRTTL